MEMYLSLGVRALQVRAKKEAAIMVTVRKVASCLPGHTVQDSLCLAITDDGNLIKK